jgi:hypothetical protein
MFLKNSLLSIVFLAGLIGSAEAQSVFDPRPRFDGTVKITRLVGTSCPAGQQGETYQAAFAAKLTPGGPAGESMTVVVPTFAGAIYFKAGGDGTFAGTNQAASGTLAVDATFRKAPNAVLNLSFTPGAITGNTPQFTFVGTVRHFTFTGCTANIRGNFVRRTVP